MAEKLVPGPSTSPSEISFAAFRKRVAADKKVSDKLKSAVEQTAENSDLLATLIGAVRAIDAP